MADSKASALTPASALTGAGEGWGGFQAGADRLFTPDLLAAYLHARSRVTIAQSGVAVSLTGTTTETVLATIAIPALGPNDAIILHSSWTYTASANQKTLRARLGGASGSLVLSCPISTVNLVRAADDRTIQNRNATNSQRISQAGSTLGAGTSAGGNNDAAIETNAGTTLVIQGVLANSAETITLESYRVEISRFT